MLYIFVLLFVATLIVMLAQFLHLVLSVVFSTMLAVADLYTNNPDVLKRLFAQDPESAQAQWAVLGAFGVAGARVEHYLRGILPDFITLSSYAASIIVLLTVIGAVFMSSRRDIVKNLIPVTMDNTANKAAATVFVMLRSTIPKSEWPKNIRFYFDPAQDDIYSLRDVWSKKIIMGTAPIVLLCKSPTAFLYCYFHEVHHIKSSDSVWVNIFISWTPFAVGIALLAYLPRGLMGLWMLEELSLAGGWARIVMVVDSILAIVLFVYFYRRLLSAWLHCREYEADRFAFTKTGNPPPRVERKADSYHPSYAERLEALTNGRYMLDGSFALFITIVFAENAGLYAATTWLMIAIPVLALAGAICKGNWFIQTPSLAMIMIYLGVSSVSFPLFLKFSLPLPAGVQPSDIPWASFSKSFLAYGTLAALCLGIYGVSFLRGRREKWRVARRERM